MSGIESVGYLGLGMLVLFFTLLIFIRQVHNENEELKSKVNELQENFDFVRKYTLSMDSELENVKGSVHVMTSSIDLAPRLKGIEDALNGLLDIVKEEHTDAVKWHSEAAERQTKPFCDDEDDASEDEGDDFDQYDTEEPDQDVVQKLINKKTEYKWIFPSEKMPTATKNDDILPVVGDEYLVIGKNFEDGKIVSDIGTWKGSPYNVSKTFSGGFDMDSYKLDKIYAYIKLPSPSDVMEKVVDVYLKER